MSKSLGKKGEIMSLLKIAQSYHLLNAYCVRHITILSHLILTETLSSPFYRYGKEVYRSQVICIDVVICQSPSHKLCSNSLLSAQWPGSWFTRIAGEWVSLEEAFNWGRMGIGGQPITPAPLSLYWGNWLVSSRTEFHLSTAVTHQWNPSQINYLYSKLHKEVYYWKNPNQDILVVILIV